MASEDNLISKIASSLPEGSLGKIQGLATDALKNLTQSDSDQSVLPPPASEQRVNVKAPAAETLVSSTTVQSAGKNYAEQLLKLGGMLEKGLINREEFDAAKASLNRAV
jgi:hypothetical protein